MAEFSRPSGFSELDDMSLESEASKFQKVRKKKNYILHGIPRSRS